jgi:hypothetical protein
MRKITTLLAAAAMLGIGLSTIPAEARDWQNSSSGHSWNNNSRHDQWQRAQHKPYWHRHYDRRAHSWYGHNRHAYHLTPGSIFGFNFR